MPSEQAEHMHREGDASRAICGACAKLVPTTFRRRNVSADTGGMVPDLLVAVCDECDAIVAIPAISTPTIRAALNASRTD